MLESCWLAQNSPLCRQMRPGLYTVTSLSLSLSVLRLFPRPRTGPARPSVAPGHTPSIPIRQGLISMSVVTADCGPRPRLRHLPRTARTARSRPWPGFLLLPPPAAAAETVHHTVHVYIIMYRPDRDHCSHPLPPPQLPNTDQTLAHFQKQMKRRKSFYFSVADFEQTI